MTNVFAIEYHYVTDQDDAMAEVRPIHRAFNQALADKGILIAAGPFVGTHDALILIRAESAEQALAFLDDDPFMLKGFIRERVPREYNPVIGEIAAEV